MIFVGQILWISVFNMADKIKPVLRITSRSSTPECPGNKKGKGRGKASASSDGEQRSDQSRTTDHDLSGTSDPVSARKDFPRHDNKEMSTQVLSEKSPFDAETAFALMNRKLDSVMQIIPVVSELKSAYDRHNETLSVSDSDSDNEDNSQECATRATVDVRDSASASTSASTSTAATSSLNYFEGLTGIAPKEGPAINSKIAEGVTNVLSAGLNPEIKESISKKYLTPSNCPRLSLIVTNAAIFNLNTNI